MRAGEEREKDTQDARSIAENSMRQAESYIKEGENLLDFQDVNLYNTVLGTIQSNMMKIGIEFEGKHVDSSFLQAKANIRIAIDKGDESFTGTNGVLFRKHRRENGKIIYISDGWFLANNSWYSAKKSAVELNQKENCESCYRLPTLFDLKNFTIDKGDVYYWSEDWTFALGGMIFGNLNVGTFTVDYIFDILFNPLDWKSYIYPISPTTLKFTGSKWEEDHLRLSRGGNWTFSWLIFYPTPFPLFGRRNPWGWDKVDFETKVRLVREVD